MRNSLWLTLLLIVLALYSFLVCIVDIIFPRGIEMWVLNVPVVLAPVFFRSRRMVVVAGLACSVKGNRIDLIGYIKDRHPTTRTLVWSMYKEDLYAERALRAGAQGYLHKGQATSQLLNAIRAVLAGKVYVSEELANNLLHRVVAGKTVERSPIDLLSSRELQTFELIGEGQTTEKIAELMNVSPKTVETYRARIKEKLGLSNVTELVQRAAQWVLESQ